MCLESGVFETWQNVKKAAASEMVTDANSIHSSVKVNVTVKSHRIDFHKIFVLEELFH